MALTLIAYQPTDSALSTDLSQALAGISGLEFDAPETADYRPWRYHDGATGARCVGDFGSSPLTADPIHPDRDYPGWQAAGLVIQIPLAGPHWLPEAVLAMVDQINNAVPGLHWLDTEDSRRDESEHVYQGDGDLGRDAEGPGPLNVPRVLASWQTQRSVHAAGRDEPHMGRERSRRLFHYRQQLITARAAHPELRWPGAMVLAEDQQAHPTCLWLDCEQDLALPPVDLVVIRRGPSDTGVLPADELRTAAQTDETLLDGLVTPIVMTDAVQRLFAEATLWPSDRFSALDDVEWAD